LNEGLRRYGTRRSTSNFGGSSLQASKFTLNVLKKSLRPTTVIFSSWTTRRLVAKSLPP